MVFSSVAFALLTLVSPLVAATEFQIGSDIRVPDGSQIGGKASKWQPTVSEYLGIPFAQPPIGPLRWQPPLKFVGNGSTSIPGHKYVCRQISSKEESIADVDIVTKLPSKSCQI